MAMNMTVRIFGRPPLVLRLPLNVPLSLFIGATPTRAAISFRLSEPSSGRSLSIRVGEDFAHPRYAGEEFGFASPLLNFCDFLIKLLSNCFDLGLK